ncbi:MAG: hypothetical protein DID90_2727552438 [Candidatus Nitrotoga sp. LAW]|nr:MAG: hypothetical protein DID90_2727552438 [Candidatus Nitrotoga sp. LAW]
MNPSLPLFDHAPILAGDILLDHRPCLVGNTVV